MYSKNFTPLHVADDLLSGFLSALKSVIHESINNEIKSILMQNDEKFTYAMEKHLIFVINTDQNANNLLLSSLMGVIVTRFFEKFGGILENFGGNVTPFQEFDEELEEIIKDKELTIHCNMCNKVITENYHKMVVGMFDLFFCCPICKKHFKMGEFLTAKHKSLQALHLCCSKCGYVQPLPNHCNIPMHIEKIGDNQRLVCYMGEECGCSDVPIHCGIPMECKIIDQ